MPVIPRVSGPTVGFQPAMQPGTSGDAYAAPGRAMQGLGQSIASLGATLDARGNDEDEYRANLELVKWQNQQDISRIKSENDFNGDPRGYANGQLQSFDSSVADLRTRLPNNPKIQQRAALHIERSRGSYNEAATKFEYGKTKEQLVADVDATITSEFSRIEAGKIEALPDDLDVSIRGINQMIDKAPVPEGAKERLRAASAQMVRAQLERLPPEQRLPAAQKIMQTIQTRNPPQEVGPQSDAGGMTGGSAISVAKTFLGKSEGQDAEALSSFFKKSAGQNLNPADTAWCAAFVNAALGASGQKGTGTLLARDFLKFGAETNEPSEGDIVVLTRGDRNGWQGHVGFYAGKSANGNIRILGGNQGNKVSVQEYSADRVLGYRKPPKSGSDLPGLSLPQVADDAGVAPSPIKTTLSAYSPQVGGSKMEGGYAASKSGPDGKAEVRTLEDVASGRSPYVTVAGNPSLAGKSYTIPEITFIGTDGKEQTLKNVKAVVHDTGSAFKSAPEGRFDVPIAKDADNALMAKNAGLWSKAGVQFVPEGAAPKGKGTQVAGLKAGTMTDAGQQGQGSAADDLTPRETDGSPEANAKETARLEAAKVRVAGGGPTFTPQSGRTSSVGLRGASADSHVLEALNKHMPAYQAAQQHALEVKIKSIDDRAAKGEIPPPAEVQQLRAMTKDHPLLSQALEQTLQGAEFTRAYMQSNPIAVDAKIQQLRGEMNTKGTSQALSVHVAALEKLQTKMDSELRKDPYGWGAEAGITPVVKPIAPQTVLTAQGADLMAERVKISDDLVKHYGEGYRQYFTPTEKTALVAGLKQGGPAAIGILTQMRTGMGDRMPDAIRELLPDEPELARAGFLAAYGGDPKGVEAITSTFARRQDKNYKPPKYAYDATSRQADAKSILGDLYEAQPDARELDRTMRAAEAIYEHLDPSGAEPGGEKWKQAVNMAVGVRVDGFGVEYGGVVPTRSGYFGSSGGNVGLPSNIAKDQFSRLRMDMTKEHLIAAGLPLPATKEGNPISMGKIATSQLVHAGFGKYYVVTKGTTPADYQYAASIGPDGKPTGKPFVLDMMALEPVLRKQFPSSYFPTK